MAREPITWLEVDDEVCSRTFGVGGCPAALGVNGVVRKCYGTNGTCPNPDAFDPVTRTLRYCEPRPNLPRGGDVMFPALESVSEISGTVNIAGSDPDLSAFGRRSTIKATLKEFAHHDRGVDPYAQERVTGAAQIDEPGYRPETRGGHFGKQRARSPYYSGRAMRRKSGFIVGGVIEDVVTRHYIQTERTMSDDGKSCAIEGMDVLDLAGNTRATAVDASRGKLVADMTTGDTVATLLPAGIGDLEYPASGRAVIGSEIVSYTRAGDVLTLTARALAGTALASHSAGDTVQQVVHVDNWRVDDTAAFLIGRKVPASFLPLVEWKAEIDRWMPQVRLQTHLCRPDEGVALLIGELAVLGVSFWWDEVAQKVRLQVNRPADEGSIVEVTDARNIVGLSLEDRQKGRLTEVMFFTVQKDPTKSATSSDNYRRIAATVATAAKHPNAHGDTRLRKIYCRWLNNGADAVVLTLSNRLLNRFASPPVLVTLTFDAKDRAIGLGDVISVASRGVQDVTGKPAASLFQVIRRVEEPGEEGSRVRVTAQAYQFSGRYAYATEETRPTYLASSPAQKARGFYACDAVTLKMSNGDEPYRAI